MKKEWQDDFEEEPVKIKKCSQRHKQHLKPYKREKYKYDENVVQFQCISIAKQW